MAQSLTCYSSALQSYEELASIINCGNISYTAINQKLEECLIKINFLIELESPDYLPIVEQLRNQLVLLQQHVAYKITTIEQLKINTPCLPPTSSAQADKEVDLKLPDIVLDTLQSPVVTGFNQVIGLREIIRTLKTLVILPKRQPQLFQKFKLFNSILLFGPPGTGKTRIVHALAAEAQAVLHCMAASDFLSVYVGETEKNIKLLFNHIKNHQKFTILFIDEIDGLCQKRSENEPAYSRRVKTELMCQMSHLQEYTNLLLIAATNCPWDLDKAILRRFQKHIYVPLPSRVERLQYFQYFIKSEQFVWPDNWNPLLDKTKGYSGSDLYNLIQNASYRPLNELESTTIWKQFPDGYFEPDHQATFEVIKCANIEDLPAESVRARPLQLEDFLIAADDVIFTVSEEDIKKYESFNGK